MGGTVPLALISSPVGSWGSLRLAVDAHQPMMVPLACPRAALQLQVTWGQVAVGAVSELQDRPGPSPAALARVHLQRAAPAAWPFSQGKERCPLGFLASFRSFSLVSVGSAWQHLALTPGVGRGPSQLVFSPNSVLTLLVALFL